MRIHAPPSSSFSSSTAALSPDRPRISKISTVPECSSVVLSFNYDRLAFGEGSDGGTSGGIAVIGFQAGLLGSRGPRVDEPNTRRGDCEKSESGGRPTRRPARDVEPSPRTSGASAS